MTEIKVVVTMAIFSAVLLVLLLIIKRWKNLGDKYTQLTSFITTLRRPDGYVEEIEDKEIREEVFNEYRKCKRYSQILEVYALPTEPALDDDALERIADLVFECIDKDIVFNMTYVIHDSKDEDYIIKYLLRVALRILLFDLKVHKTGDTIKPNESMIGKGKIRVAIAIPSRTNESKDSDEHLKFKEYDEIVYVPSESSKANPRREGVHIIRRIGNNQYSGALKIITRHNTWYPKYVLTCIKEELRDSYEVLTIVDEKQNRANAYMRALQEACSKLLSQTLSSKKCEESIEELLRAIDHSSVIYSKEEYERRLKELRDEYKGIEKELERLKGGQNA